MLILSFGVRSPGFLSPAGALELETAVPVAMLGGWPCMVCGLATRRIAPGGKQLATSSHPGMDAKNCEAACERAGERKFLAVVPKLARCLSLSLSKTASR
jgi:hypothetical protein